MAFKHYSKWSCKDTHTVQGCDAHTVQHGTTSVVFLEAGRNKKKIEQIKYKYGVIRFEFCFSKEERNDNNVPICTLKD